MSNDSDFSIEGWDEFVENFAKLVDKWAEKKAELLKKLGNIYHSEVIPLVPTDTSTLVNSIFVFGEGIPQDYIEIGTNIEYALYVNDGHIQHKRALKVENLTVGGKKKGYKTTKDGKYVLLSERYIPGVYFLEEAKRKSEPRWKNAVDSFMVQTAREVEGGKL